MLRLIWILVLIIGFSTGTTAQSKIDSLELVLETINDDSLKILTYQHLRHIYQRTDLNKALEYALLAESLAEKTGLQFSLGEAKYRKGTVLINMSLYDEAEAQFYMALDIFIRLGALKKIAIVKVDLARVMATTSRVEEAFRLYLEALSLTKETGNRNSEARIHNFLGQLYKSQKQFDRAIEHYDVALKIVTELNFKPGISACLANLGSIYTDLRVYDKAIEYLEKSLVIKNETGDKLGASRVLSNLGDIANDRLEYELAFKYLNRALLLVQEVNQPADLAIVQHGLARNAFYRNDFLQCVQICNQILANMKMVQDLELTAKTHKLLSEAFGQTGQYDKAYQHATLHNQLSDSLYNEEILKVTNDLEAKYQNDQKAAEIALQLVQLSKRETERNYLIIMAAVALLLAVLIFNQYRIKYRANTKLRELDKLKSDFFANISHEFRTPLSLVMAPIKKRIDQSNDQKDKEEFSMMYRNADRLLTLIDQLLDLSKLENQSIKLEKTEVDVNHYFKIIAASFSSFADHKKISFSNDLPEEGMILEFDQDVLQKICNNLLSNAFKFTPEDGTVHLSVRLADNQLEIAISDSGQGIPLVDQKNVFDRFYRTTEGNETGTGIGLALTKELAEFHEGKIKMESLEGVGTKFTVTIPVQSITSFSSDKSEGVVNENNNKNVHVEKDLSIHDNHPQILIIEDNPDLREYLRKNLKEQYSIHVSKDGEEGIGKAKQIIPDLIISDIMMPKKDGIEVCNELRAATETNHIPIILLTARADQESKLSGLSSGADDYLLKPFDAAELEIRIANLLEQRNRLKEKYTQFVLAEPLNNEPENPRSVFLYSASTIVGQHLNDPDFGAEMFCEEMAMSRMQLHRKLKALTNLSASEFIRTHRLNKAALLLKDNGDNVTGIGYEVGFNNPSYFSKCFKERFGISPSEFANQSQLD